MAEIKSRPYHPNPEMCCEACVFGNGEHAEWCPRSEERRRWIERLSEPGPRIVADGRIPKGVILLVGLRKQDESVADWLKRCAVINQPQECREWYLKNRERMKLHTVTREWIEQQLGVGGKKDAERS